VDNVQIISAITAGQINQWYRIKNGG
jgi:hypothetical protein